MSRWENHQHQNGRNRRSVFNDKRSQHAVRSLRPPCKYLTVVFVLKSGFSITWFARCFCTQGGASTDPDSPGMSERLVILLSAVVSPSPPRQPEPESVCSPNPCGVEKDPLGFESAGHHSWDLIPSWIGRTAPEGSVSFPSFRAPDTWPPSPGGPGDASLLLPKSKHTQGRFLFTDSWEARVMRALRAMTEAFPV